jgi:hypothetical protein
MRKTVDKVKNYLHHHPHVFITDAAYQLSSLKHAPEMAEIIWEVKKALDKGIPPERSLHGSTATLFLKDCNGSPIAVFKNERCLYELIAYRLDYGHFAGVPQTVLTTLDHPLLGGRQTGSCQMFVQHAMTAVEMDQRLYPHFSASSVRRIAALDIRMMNEDRHSSNILIVNQKEIVPIDHGFVFPHFLSDIYLTWVDWAQAATHFTEAELSYISLLDPEQDRRMMLDEMHFEEMLANRLFVATVLLKLFAVRRKTAAEIGKILARKHPPGVKEATRFELLLEKIKERNPANWLLFTRYVYEEVEKFFDYYEKISEPEHQSTYRRI